MDESTKTLPHYKVHIQENWTTYKGQIASKLKPLIVTLCQPLTDAEDKEFAKWYENQKTIEAKRLKRQHGRLASSTNTSINLPEAYNAGVLTQIDSVSDGISELTIEEKKQEQNVDLLLKKEASLVQQLLQCTSKEDKLSFLRSQLQTSFLMVLTFMQARREAPSDFLEVLLTLCQEIEEQDLNKQTLLFVRICALYQKEQLPVTKDLVRNALVELASETFDDYAATGLLKLSYINRISFKAFPLDALNKFQERYGTAFKKFLAFLEYQQISYEALKCLPHSCFIFTKPFYNILLDSGALLCQNVDPNYQVQFVELLVYSFEGEWANVLEFIDIFTKGCIQIYGKGIQLLPLLERIINREQQQDKTFFGSLHNQILLFRHLFDQLKEKRILKLDEEIINSLLEVNEEEYLKHSKQPRILNSNDEAETRLMQYWQQMQAVNAGNLPSSFLPTVPRCSSLAKMISLFGIKCLNPAQMVSFLLIKEQFQSHRIFQRFTTGSGKTTFSLIWMLYTWLQFKIPSIANYTSLELCHYDYERLFKQAESLGLPILLISKEEHLTAWKPNCIMFTTTPLLSRLADNPQIRSELVERQLILDEFDAAIFDTEAARDHTLLFMDFRYLVAFTGSPLEEVHKNIVQRNLDGWLVQYPPLGQVRGRDNVCQGTHIFGKRPEQVKAIVDLCVKQVSHTPVLVILDESVYISFIRKATSGGLLVKNLAQTDPAGIKSFFSTTLTNAQNGQYYVAVLSLSQGRGLDVPTTSAIEKAGGVYVVIASMPSTFRQLEQFKGRTARMGGRGQYSLMLLAKTQSSGETFLQESLTAVSSRELEHLARECLNVVAPQLSNVILKKTQDQEENKINEGPKQDGEEGKQQIESDKQIDPFKQGQGVIAISGNELDKGLNINYKAQETQKPVWQPMAEYIQEEKILQEFAPYIQKESACKQSLVTGIFYATKLYSSIGLRISREEKGKK